MIAPLSDTIIKYEETPVIQGTKMQAFNVTPESRQEDIYKL
jgi:hypothetical protein